jgi:phosphatidylglycerol:prolipoprotein diacylglycerol transferase
MFPELVRIDAWDYSIPTYGVLLAIAMAAAVWTGVRFAAADGLDRSKAYNLAIYTIAASLVGSKLLLVITEPWLLSSANLGSRELWRSGGVYFGGFLAAFGASILFARLLGLEWWRLADAFAPAIALGQAIGRLGCFAAGCCWGVACDLPWAVEFGAHAHETTGVPAGVGLHPVQLYESALSIAIFAALVWLRRHRSFRGQIVLAYLALYSAARFTLEHWRDDPRGDVLGLTTLTGLSTSQLISAACGLAALALLVLFHRRSREGGEGEPRDPEPSAAALS